MELIKVAENPATIAILANTHGPMAQGVFEALQGSDLIVHAGDIGGKATLDILNGLGRVIAVRGNSDRSTPLSDLPEAIAVGVGSTRILVVHNHSRLPWPPQGIGVVISGLWHQPSISEKDGTLLVSPGCAATGWAGIPVSIARLVIAGDGVEPALIMIEDPDTPLRGVDISRRA